MSRSLIALVALAGVAHAEEQAASSGLAPKDMSDQAIGPSLGIAAGGRTTPGGLMLAGHYLYQLADQDWFDGRATFVFGGGDAECFRNRSDVVICEHGLADGYAGGVEAGVRRFLPALANSDGTFWPFLRGALGASLVRFSNDEVTGIVFALHAGPGLRVSIDENISIVALADLVLGLGAFGNGVGAEPQLGINISAGAEFKL